MIRPYDLVAAWLTVGTAQTPLREEVSVPVDLVVDDLRYLENEILNMSGVLDVRCTVPAAGHVLLTVTLREFDFDTRHAVLAQVDAFHRWKIERLSVEVTIVPAG